MKSITAIVVMTLTAMGTGSASFAQEYRPRAQDQDPQRTEQRDRRSDNNGRQQMRRVETPRQMPHEARQDVQGRTNHGQQKGHGRDPVRHGQVVRSHAPAHGPVYDSYGARGPQFRTGVAIPVQYRSYNYVVNNWHDHHLHAPRRGQQWVQVGADYALIAITTGILVQLVLSH